MTSTLTYNHILYPYFNQMAFMQFKAFLLVHQELFLKIFPKFCTYVYCPNTLYLLPVMRVTRDHLHSIIRSALLHCIRDIIGITYRLCNTEAERNCVCLTPFFLDLPWFGLVFLDSPWFGCPSRAATSLAAARPETLTFNFNANFQERQQK